MGTLELGSASCRDSSPDSSLCFTYGLFDVPCSEDWADADVLVCGDGGGDGCGAGERAGISSAFSGTVSLGIENLFAANTTFTACFMEGSSSGTLGLCVSSCLDLEDVEDAGAGGGAGGEGDGVVDRGADLCDGDGGDGGGEATLNPCSVCASVLGVSIRSDLEGDGVCGDPIRVKEFSSVPCSCACSSG